MEPKTMVSHGKRVTGSDFICLFLSVLLKTAIF